VRDKAKPTDYFLLPGLPRDKILAAYAAAPGKELASGKFGSVTSSAVLAANAFGVFLDNPAVLPPLPGSDPSWFPATAIALEATVRLPWAGGTHPCLDVLIKTPTALIGIESERFEPFDHIEPADFRAPYDRDWGTSMEGYLGLRDGLRANPLAYRHLNACQLVKHAFGLRSAVHRKRWSGKVPLLVYLYSEPALGRDGRPIPPAVHQVHRAEILRFGAAVSGSEVGFLAVSYEDLLASWAAAGTPDLAAHAAAVRAAFFG
jgi:hypothetical protein